MAILNVTNDSFYSPSRCGDRALAYAKKCIKEGAEIIDIGAQSTRPNYVEISALEEMSLLVPAIEAIKSEIEDVPISVDTYYADVAQSAIDLGVDMINDVSNLQDEDMCKVIANGGVAVCAMHNRRDSKMADMFLDKQIGINNLINKLLNVGVPKCKIMLDGGIGFNKNINEDWQLLDGYKTLINTFDEYPFLLGASRKSMFGGEVENRLSATLESTIKAKEQGVLFVRVHDVANNVAVLNI